MPVQIGSSDNYVVSSATAEHSHDQSSRAAGFCLELATHAANYACSHGKYATRIRRDDGDGLVSDLDSLSV